MKSIKYLAVLLSTHIRFFTFIAGSMAMSAWTMLRFFIKPSTFDLVGQQVLAHQWLSGIHGGALVGQTNYLLKLFLLYMPLDYVSVSPRLKLIGLTLLINIATFILLVVVLEKIWLEFYKTIPRSFYLMMGWFALSAGAIFWIQYANSRNLEVVGGLFVVYLLLTFERRKRIRDYLLLAGISAVVFFADPLQLYMTAIPALAYVGLVSFRTQKNLSKSLFAAGLVALGAIVARAAASIFEHIYKTSLVTVTQPNHGTLIHYLFESFKLSISQTARLYVGGYELGRYIEAASLLVVGLLIITGLWYLVTNKISKKLSLLVLIFWVCDGLVYIASSQTLVTGTSRYMMMTVPLFVLFAAAVLRVPSKLQRLLQVLLGVVLVVMASSLVFALIRNWDMSFPRDSRNQEVITYLKSHNYAYGVAGIYTAQPVNYVSGGDVTLLPVTCEAGSILRPSNLYFDHQYYLHTFSGAQAEVPFILDGTVINFPYVCTKQQIKNQLGEWNRIDYLPDGSEVLIYANVRALSN